MRCKLNDPTTSKQFPAITEKKHVTYFGELCSDYEVTSHGCVVNETLIQMYACLTVFHGRHHTKIQVVKKRQDYSNFQKGSISGSF